jgi:hypothetical protein
MALVYLYDDLETLLRFRLNTDGGSEEDTCYQEYKCYEKKGLEDALAALRRLAGKGCNHAFICQTLKQRYLRWLDSNPWSDPVKFKKGMAFSIGYYKLLHELEKMRSVVEKT